MYILWMHIYLKNNGFIDLRSFTRDENYSERREILIKNILKLKKYEAYIYIFV